MVKDAISYGFNRTAASITTVSFIFASMSSNHKYNTTLVVFYILWAIITWYKNIFDFLKAKMMPTARLYNTRIPTFLSYVVSLMIISYTAYLYLK